MNAEPLSVLKLVGDASIVVQLVLGLLLAASIASWAIILGKRSVLARARGEAERFEASFWSGGDLGSLYRTLEARGGNSGMSSIFEMGFREFARQQGRRERVERDMALQELFEEFASMVDALRRVQVEEIADLDEAIASARAAGVSEADLAKIVKVRERMQAALDG